MTLAIDEAQARICHIQKTLAITEYTFVDDDANLVTVPHALEIKRAYPYFPDASTLPNIRPCFINQWSGPEVSYRSAVVLGNFSTRMVLLTEAGAQTARGAAIASAFFWQLVQAFAANVKLGGWGPATVLALRGGQPTLTADLPYTGVGLDMQLDYHLNAALTMAPGSF